MDDPSQRPGARRRSSALLAAFLAAAPAAAQQAPGDAINVLLVMSDQHNARVLGRDDGGFGGLDESPTPRLDALADEGVRFSSAHCVTPQCCPARYTVLTGRWPHSHGLRVNEVWEPGTSVTFPELARRAGYATGSFGKHHMMWLEQGSPATIDHGFEVVKDLDDYWDHCTAHGVPTWSAPGNHHAMDGLPSGLNKTGYTFNADAFHPDGYAADQAIGFLRQRAGPEGDGRPFVCWLQPTGPHTPILPSGPADPNDWAHRFHPFGALSLPRNLDKVATTERLALLQAHYAGVEEAQWREVLSYSYGLVAQIDHGIGRVLDELDALGLADRTLVVYLADHGEMATEMACWAKGAGHYEAVSRVPWIMRLPDVLPAGVTRAALVSQVDLVPTLLELTGVPVPDVDRARLDGRSALAPALADATPEDWRDVLFGEFGGNLGRRTRMARTAIDKYTLDEQYVDEEYYQLVDDPWEREDRIAAPADQARIAELRAELEGWWNAEEGHAPIYRTTGPASDIPERASSPEPGDAAAGVPCDVDPTWVPSTSAWTQRVMLGTDPGALSQYAELEHMEASFNPGTLAPATTWYWRVDGVNGNGTQPGPVWSFTTGAGPAGPGLATAPAPARRAQDVPRPVQLFWTPAADASAQRLALGAVGVAASKVHDLPADAGSFDPGPLLAGVAYAWRVDSVSAQGTTVGDLWRFTTSEDGLAGFAEPVVPAHLEEDVAVGSGFELSWTPAAGATEHLVHFGAGFPLPLRAETTRPRWATGPLEPGRVYYWRVDERNDAGTRLGYTWRFRARE